MCMFELKCPLSQQQQKSILYIPHVKATQNIAAGEEIFNYYGDSEWFEKRDLPYVDVDVALTTWRPELTPLACSQPVHPKTAYGGDDVSYIITKGVPAGTVLETSACLEMPAYTVDTYSIGDFVVTGHTENMHDGCQ